MCSETDLLTVFYKVVGRNEINRRLRQSDTRLVSTTLSSGPLTPDAGTGRPPLTRPVDG